MRRTMLARQAALAALIVIPGVACGRDDASVFDAASEVVDGSESSEASATVAPEATTPTADATETTDTSSSIETTEPAATPDTGADTIPAGSELQVSFSYVASSGGQRVENPYIAVWIEDLEGNLVQTISVWFEQSGKGARYLSDLPAWYAASDRASDVTMSGATRVAGDYTVVWDGTDLDGNPVAEGDYVLFVEAAREHGPYQITSQQLTLGTDGFTVELADDGELAAVSATFVA